MPESTPLSLRMLLPERLEHMEEAVRDAVGAEGNLKPGRVAWRFFGEKVADCLQGAIDTDVLKLLASAWSRVRELRAYAGPPDDLRGQTIAVTLGKHELTHTVHLDLELTINGASAGPPVRLDLDLRAVIESVVLIVRDGCVIGAGSGEGTVSAQLKYKGVKLHDEVRSASLASRDYLTLDPCITLP